jgi:hypothetical protein
MKLKKIKHWDQYRLESISGWELVGKDMGPSYPEHKYQNSIDNFDTMVISAYDGNLYGYEEFQDLRNQYRIHGGREILQDFTEKNLNSIIQYLKSIP